MANDSARTKAALLAAIADIDVALDTGATTVVSDGVTSTVDLEFLRKRRVELSLEIDSLDAEDETLKLPTRFRPVQLP